MSEKTNWKRYSHKGEFKNSRYGQTRFSIYSGLLDELDARGGYYKNMSNSEYWKLRSQKNQNEVLKHSKEAEQIIKKRYRYFTIDLCKQYRDLINPFIKADGTIDIGALNKALTYDSNFKYKVNKLHTVIDEFCIRCGTEDAAAITKALENTYIDTIKSISSSFGVEPPIYLLSDTAIQNAVNARWANDGIPYSDRIWNNADQIKQKLSSTLTDSLMKGQSINKTLYQFKKITGNSTYNCARIIRTETIAAHTAAAIDGYKAFGVDELEVSSEPNCCEVCQGFNGKRFAVNQAVEGINAPPFHPFCKCAVIPVVDW